jgi:hypothetical protein
MEFDLDKINADWEIDSSINELDIAESIRDCPKLHAKYIAWLSKSRMRLRAYHHKYRTLRQSKFRYYRGEMTKDELDKLGWPQWQGAKPLKNEMDEFLKGDADLSLLEDKIAYMEVIVQALEQIIRSINSRGYDLRTLLDAKKFYNGLN